MEAKKKNLERIFKHVPKNTICFSRNVITSSLNNNGEEESFVLVDQTWLSGDFGISMFKKNSESSKE